MKDLTDEETEEARIGESDEAKSESGEVSPLKSERLAPVKTEEINNIVKKLVPSEVETLNSKPSEQDSKGSNFAHGLNNSCNPEIEVNKKVSPKLNGSSCLSSLDVQPSESEGIKETRPSNGLTKPGPSGEGCYPICQAERDRIERGARLGAKIFAAEKFVPREELVTQIMDMGICRNGAVKALYWTGNHSALSASNWIFDQPDRDLETPLEDELEMIRAQQAEREREEREEREGCLCSLRQQSHLHSHHDLDSSDLDEEELMDEEDEGEEDEEEEEDIDDDDDEMEFKMVFVVNKSLDMRAGSMAVFVGKAASALTRMVGSQPQSVPLGHVELEMWADLGEKMNLVQGDSCQHMKDLELMAKNLRLPCHMVEHREGHTRKAVLGIFGEEREVNKVTGRLKVVND